MPRVSQAHRDARRRQILDAARRCFVRNGFHATSMQHILTEADLSAGATYRYFKSKEEIIIAIAEEMLGRMKDVFAGILETDEPPPIDEAFLRIGRTFEQTDAEFDIGKIVVQVWSEAARNPDLRAKLLVLVGQIRRRMSRLVRAYQRRGEIGPGDPEAIAKVLVALWPGFILQRVVIGDVGAEEFARGLRSIVGQGKVTG